ncbi:MAG: hypothetical protein QOJ61_163, partial [Mycobacterium sp.]|nr:hypothetical protein [Mycobacterium sp.]
MRVTARPYVARVLELLFPVACPGCGRDVASRGPICGDCETTLRPAVPVPPPSGIDGWLAPFAYEGLAREVVARAKYRGVRAAVPWLG